MSRKHGKTAVVAFKEAVVRQFQVKQGQLSPLAEAELHTDETGLRAELGL